MNYKILLVDDDKDLLQMLSSYFELKGYFIETAVQRTGSNGADKGCPGHYPAGCQHAGA